MFNLKSSTAKGDRPQFFAFSINGGDSNLGQSQNVELMYLNPRNDELELYDLEFKKNQKPHLSNPNPTDCLRCHGNGGEKMAGGPRAIFDPFGRWNRFVGGRSPYCNDTEKQYFTKIEDHAVEAAVTSDVCGRL